MSKFIYSTLTAALMICCTCAFADKLTVKGDPVTLEKRGDIFVAPSEYKPSTDYRFIAIGEEKSVCYLEKQPKLQSLEFKTITVDVGGKQNTWNCYTFTPDYFLIEKQ